MDFLVELFRNFYQHQDWGMQQSCTDSYGKTLKKWHGWIASSSFMVTFSQPAQSITSIFLIKGLVSIWFWKFVLGLIKATFQYGFGNLLL